MLALARKLDRCRAGKRCGSGACPVCLERLQTRYAKAIRRVARKALRRGYQVGVITWVPADAAIAPSLLHTRDHQNQIRVWKRRLSPTNMLWLLGGVDFSLNEDRIENTPAHWASHLHGLAATRSIARLKRELKRAAGRTPEVARSVKVKLWDGRLNAPMYALKGEYRRRTSYQGERFLKSTGRRASCRKTTEQRLLAVQKLELLRHLDETGLQARIFTVRAQVHHSRDSVHIRLV